MPDRKMKIGLAQVSASKDIKKNTEKAISFLRLQVEKNNRANISGSISSSCLAVTGAHR